LLLLAFAKFAIPQTPERKPQEVVYLTSECSDTVGGIAASALREKIRASVGYTLAFGSTKGHSGLEITLTCAALPGHESSGSAVSYVFAVFLSDGARFFVEPGVGVVGVDAVDGWTQNVFSQFDNWVSIAHKAMSN